MKKNPPVNITGKKRRRLEKNIAPDGGVQTRYWLLRNKLFIETLEQLKSLPCDTFLIAHEDFILNPLGDNASVKEKTNAMVWQKIRCERKVSPNEIQFVATIDKSKYRVESEGREMIFCTVNKTTKEVKWDTTEVLKSLI